MAIAVYWALMFLAGFALFETFTRRRGRPYGVNPKTGKRVSLWRLYREIPAVWNWEASDGGHLGR